MKSGERGVRTVDGEVERLDGSSTLLHAWVKQAFRWTGFY
jgi:hypothetical protein